MRSLLWAALVLSPTFLGMVYFGFIATERYVSDTTFVVRNATSLSGAGGLTSLLRVIGISTAKDDTFAVHDYIASRDSTARLQELMDLKGVYGADGVDFLSRFPNIFYRDTADEFQNYLRNRIIVTYNPNTGISRLQIHAFSAQDAQRVATHLITLSEALINQVNERIHADAIRFASSEVRSLEARLRETQVALTEFRNRELQIDPNRSSVLVIELIGKLSDELARTTTQIAEVQASAPNSPQLAGLERRAFALRREISNERARVTDASDGLAQNIARFESLNLERELAMRSLAAAIKSLDAARAEARRKQLYLERISGPTLPDKAAQPKRLAEIFTILGVNLIVMLMLWLIKSGVTEHAPRLRDEP